MARKPRLTPVVPVTWRDGVHLTGTPIWCDARRRRDVCFVSSAERIHLGGKADSGRLPRAVHGQLIATPTTLALLGADAGHLAVPVHRPFTLGTTRLVLIPSGRGLGAAALHVDLGARTVLYAGAIRTVNPAEAAEVRACDAVVVNAAIGEAETLATLEDVAGQVLDWVRVQLVSGRAPVLVVDTVFDGFEVASYLAAAGITVAGARSIRDAAARVATHATVVPIAAPGREPAVLVRLEGDRVKPADGVHVVSALVSTRAVDVSLHADWDDAFAWPFVADHTQLLNWIEQSRAKDVYLTGAHADAVAQILGSRARVLGPPRQMALFGS